MVTSLIASLIASWMVYHFIAQDIRIASCMMVSFPIFYLMSRVEASRIEAMNNSSTVDEYLSKI